MGRVITLVGFFLLAIGGWRATTTAIFVKSALRVSGQVVAVEELRGPPKPRQKTPLHVMYSLPDGTQHRAITNLPFMRIVKEGDVISVLVDPSKPEEIRLPDWAELWAGPLTYIIGGILLVVLSTALRARSMRS